MADIRIRDLAAFSGTPTANDFLAIDSANETKKIPGNVFALDNKTKLNVTPLGSTRDLNELYGNDNTGYYYIAAGVANAPVSYASLIVICPVSTHPTTHQLIVHPTGLYWRAYYGDSLAWTEWKSVGQTTSQAFTGEYINNSWYVRRNGNVVNVQMGSFSKVDAGRFVMNGAIPEGFRPTVESYYTVITKEATPRILSLTITPSGDMNFYNYNAAYSGALTAGDMLTYIL